MPALVVHGERELRMAAQPPRGGALPKHLSAASGLVRRGERCYVVADDEHHLALFDATGPGRWWRLFDGALPEAAAQRKAAKPDLETLLELPPTQHHPHGALLALGSGSRPNRQRAVCLPFADASGALGAARAIDLAPLYAGLRGACADLNIEGAFVAGGVFHLLQRGHAGQPVNLCIRFDWAEVQAWLNDGGAVPRARGIERHELGVLDGVPLGFTDATPLPDGAWAFSAAAEATDDSYHDGACAGSVLGIVGGDGRCSLLQRLPGGHKVEGIASGPVHDPGIVELTLVSDADDRECPAKMWQVRLDPASC
jgi:hypothetical protein